MAATDPPHFPQPHPKRSGAWEPLINGGEAVDVVSHAGPPGISLQLMQCTSAGGGGDITGTLQTVLGGGGADREAELRLVSAC